MTGDGSRQQSRYTYSKASLEIEAGVFSNGALRQITSGISLIAD
jgi:hypothetical protein